MYKTIWERIKAHLYSKAKCFLNHVTQHFRVLQRHLRGHVTEVGLLVVVEVEERGSEEEKGGSLSSFQPKQLNFHLFNTENSAKELGEEEEIQVIKIKVWNPLA